MEYLSDESWQWDEEDSENESKDSSDNYKSSVWYAAWFVEATDLRNILQRLNQIEKTDALKQFTLWLYGR